jgi:gliding motility-associated-like protein
MKPILTYCLPGRLFASKAVIILCFLSFISLNAFSQINPNETKKTNSASTTALSNSAGIYGGSATLSVTLTFNNGGLPTVIDGASVGFSMNGVGLGSATTTDGVATLTISLTSDGTPTGTPLNPGVYSITASYAGNAADFIDPSSGAATLTVTGNTNLALSNSTGTYGGSATLTTTLTQAGNNNPLSGELVTFNLGNPATQVGTATTDVNGVATLTISLTADGTPGGTLLNDGVYSIATGFASNGFFIGSNSTTASLTVNPPTAISVTGTPSALSATSGTASSSATFNVSGASLTPGNLTVTAPSGFDVSANNSTWSGSGGNFTIAETGTLSSTPVYIRLDAADAPKSYSGNITISGGGAATVNVAMPLSAVSTTINAITASSTYSNAATIQFTVTFGASITGLSASNFSLTTTGAISGASVSSVSSGTNSYTVTVNTGTGSGTIGLNLANATGLPPISTTLPFAGGTTTIDKTAPTITIGLPSVSSIIDGAGTVTYSVTYADANFKTSTLTTANITLNKTSTASGTIGLSGSGTSYTVTISGITGAGTLGISVAAGTASDLAGNLAPASAASATFNVVTPVISTTGTPSALSATSGTASSSTTFNVSGANMAAGILVTPPAGFEVSTNNSTFSSTVTVGSSGAIASTPVYIRLKAADAANTYQGSIVLSSTAATNVNISMPLSTVFTTINAITPVSTYSNAATIQFTVTFGSPITGLSAGNFSLTTTGAISGASISSVSSGTNSYTVTVNTGNGDGTIGLNLANTTGLTPDISTTLPFKGGTTTIDKTPPTITIGQPSVSLVDDDFTGFVTYSVTYADANFKTSTLAISNITLNLTGTANAGVHSVTGSGTSYTVSVAVEPGAGTVGISIAAGTASDLAGNLAPAPAASTTFNVVQPIITVPGGTITIPGTTAGTAGASTSFNISGSNLTAGNLTVAVPTRLQVSADNVNWGSKCSIPVSGTLSSTPVYVRISATAALGPLTGDVAISGGDAAEVFQVVSGTVATTISSLTAQSSTLTNASTVQYTATFVAPVSGLSTADFALNSSGITGASILSVSGLDSSWTVAVNTGAGDGTIRLLLNGSPDITPSVSNVPFSGDTYTVDKTPPTITIGSPSVSSIADGAGSVTYSVTYADANFNTSTLTTANITLNKTSTAGGTVGLSGSGTSYTVTISGITGAGTLGISIAAGTASDLAGNLAPASAASATFNAVTPVISTSGTPSALSTTSGTASSSTSFNVSGANLTAGNLTVTAPSGFDVSANNSTWSGSGGNFTIAETGTLASTPVYIRLDAADAPNSYSGNIAISGGGAATVNVAMPLSAVSTTINAIAASSSYSNAATIQFTVTFGASITGLSTGNFSLTTTGTISGASVGSVSSGTNSYTVTVNTGTGSGTIGLNLANATGLTPGIGTTLPFTGGATTVDKTAPTVTIGAPSVASVSGNGSGSVTYTITYADANFNTSSLTSSGITLNPSGTATGAVGLTGSGTAYTVTVSNITGAGTLGISVTGGYASDLAGNTDPGAGPSATFNVLSSDASLSKLTVSSGTLSPAFATGTTSYTDVAHAVSSIAFRATTTNPLATETINGTAVPAGTVSPYFPLNAGVNAINVAVTAQDGVTTKTYTIAVTRLPEIATLSGLTISNGTLSPAFATGTTSYTDVAHSVSSIAFRATTTDPLATETINGTAVPEGTVSPYFPLNAGLNTITVVVTAQDGITEDTYTVGVTRLPDVATLSGLTISNGTLSPAFATATASYTDVAHSVSSIAFRATTTDPLATETINGTAVPEGTVSPYFPLNAGLNTITVVVTAQDGITEDTYTIGVTRLPDVATLSGLTISNGTLSPAFATATASYTDVVHSVSSIAFRATTTDPLATETINGTAVPEGTVSPYFPLNVGLNTITVVVTAQDGITQDIYTIAVTRLPDIASLSGLTISSGTLSPAFATGTTSYTDNVANAVSSIAFRATTTDALATETISGTAVPEGTVSFYVPLSVGLNKIPIIVTAQDGVTTETYSIDVTRAAPAVADAVYQPVSVEITETLQLANDGILVHQGVSPNGDGIDDFLQIDNITNYPDNRLMIMNRNGMLVYEAKGYDNASKLFDGHSNKNGQMQLPGTYFYELDYTINGIIKHKTGFLILKY